MYFWRIEALKQRMAGRPLTDREVLPYLVVYCALYAATNCLAVTPDNAWDIASAVWTLLLAILGTIHIFRQNGGSGGEHFLQRYFAIGWVVTIRWIAIGIPCLLAFYLPLGIFGPETEGTRWYDFLIVAVLEALVYWRIGHHVRDLAMRTKAPAPPILA